MRRAIPFLVALLFIAGCGGGGGAETSSRSTSNAAAEGSGLPVCTSANFPATPSRRADADRLGGLTFEDGFNEDGGEPAVLLPGEECEIEDAPKSWPAEDRVWRVG